MKLASIHLYPIKSTRGHDVTTARVEPWGLAGDRRFLVTSDDGTMLTARKHPRLFTCLAELGDGALTLTGPHAAPLRVALTPSPSLRTVSVWDTPVDVTDCGDEAAAWLSSLLDTPARLVWLDDPTRRAVDPLYGMPDDRVMLADGFPLLLASTASVDRLNDWIAEDAVERGEELPEPLPISRFRPNVVVSGVEEAFAEDRWKRIRIGEVEFRVASGCARCVMTTIDVPTLEKGKEPLRVLAKHRRWDGKVWFGMNLIPDTTGTIHQNDPITIL
ncbi:MOSC domain-containing protein [Nonomuraea sp. NPDC050556]|uniref:MOSC domain-containing protein n=1 Tax=Nonomuraea sp. NPDC050556 TaxID=3364369 RepID=UPI0037BB27B4